MANTSSTRQRSKQDAAMLSGGVAGAIALALCCGGALLAIAFGFTALAAFLINPWFLIPVVLLAAGVVYWRSTRKNAACDVPPIGDEDQQ
ncbi:MAG: hypothetical protein BMS9Abin17_0197 [Acidimicrobiia bacterium]|nr:MAG: hypothetical protein BMS9Abin17_0197 [Acidimicrobiia bacterium]